MKDLIKLPNVDDKIICIRNQNVILSNDVAELYGVETREVNQAIKNNPDKFPEGYVFELNNKDLDSLRSKFLILDKQGRGKHMKYSPKAFTEKGLYMLATILKSPQATQTTIAVVEAFSKLRELTNNIAVLNSIDAEVIEPEIIKSTVEKTGGLLNDLFFSALPTSAETSFELNLGLMKARHSVKSEKPIYQSEFDELKKMMEKINERLDKL